MNAGNDRKAAPILDELHYTLEELAKAADNLVYMQKTFGSLRKIDLSRFQEKMTSLLSSPTFLDQLKHINLDEISALLQSPLIRQLLTDPEFYQLFAPDKANPSLEKNKD